ncbi:ATP-binding cassette domain-containing protein [Nonomuraea sp. NPDC048881]|uniref:ATP-binding cassette domain-containing protein n=1 Tax=Nonomuraea sp. NPDC048881 TaxID=3155030 RepID=UPI0033CBD32C
MGPSGSGKTTLLTTLAGLLPPAKGRVMVRGVPLDEQPALRAELALVFQSHGLLSLLTAAENVEVALRAAGRPPKEAVGVAAAGAGGHGGRRHAGRARRRADGDQGGAGPHPAVDRAAGHAAAAARGRCGAGRTRRRRGPAGQPAGRGGGVGAAPAWHPRRTTPDARVRAA